MIIFLLVLVGSYTKLFNEKNTEISINGNVFVDTWNAAYSIELRPFAAGCSVLKSDLITQIALQETLIVILILQLLIAKAETHMLMVLVFLKFYL